MVWSTRVSPAQHLLSEEVLPMARMRAPQREWRVSRSWVGSTAAERRWRQAYHLLIRTGAATCALPAIAPTNPSPAQEYADASNAASLQCPPCGGCPGSCALRPCVNR